MTSPWASILHVESLSGGGNRPYHSTDLDHGSGRVVISGVIEANLSNVAWIRT